MSEILNTLAVFRGQRRKLEIYYGLFQSDAGQEVLADLASRFMVYGTTFDPQSARVSAFNEGARNVVLDLIKRSRTTPEAILAKLEQMESQDVR